MQNESRAGGKQIVMGWLGRIPQTENAQAASFPAFSSASPRGNDGRAKTKLDCYLAYIAR